MMGDNTLMYLKSDMLWAFTTTNGYPSHHQQTSFYTLFCSIFWDFAFFELVNETLVYGFHLYK